MFSLSILGIFIVTATIVFLITFFAYKINGFDWRMNHALVGPVILLIASAIVGTCISLIIGHKGIVKVHRINTIVKEIATGNFNLKLNESSHVDEIQELIENFNIMIHELGTIETLRTDFVSNVSHEFKTPLAAIEGYAVLLQDDTLTQEELQEYTSMIIESSKQLSTLTGNILKLSKMENQDFYLTPKTFRLDEQIREAILLLENKWSEKKLSINLDLTNYTYTGEKSLLLLIWTNLLDNAIKFSNPEGTIDIKMFAHEDYVKIVVKDQGIGMSSNDMSRIFNKFYQIDQARNTVGNGLGLALTKKIVDICDGYITVESILNHGSTFVVSLPVKNTN